MTAGSSAVADAALHPVMKESKTDSWIIKMEDVFNRILLKQLLYYFYSGLSASPLAEETAQLL